MVSEASALSPSPLEVPSEGTHHRKGRTLLRPGTESSNPSLSSGESGANLAGCRARPAGAHGKSMDTHSNRCLVKYRPPSPSVERRQAKDHRTPLCVRVRASVRRVVAMVAAKVGAEAARDRDRKRLLAQMARELMGFWQRIGSGTGKTGPLGDGREKLQTLTITI